MTESAQLHADAPLLDPRALLLPSLVALLQELAAQLPPASPAQRLNVQQLLRQLRQAIEVVDLQGLDKLLQTMEQHLQTWPEFGMPTDPKTGELLQWAARDAAAYAQQLLVDTDADPQSLFPSYRALVKLSGKDVAHPADLCDDQELQSLQLPTSAHQAQPKPPSAALRAALDQHMLSLMRGELQHCAADFQACLEGLAAFAPADPTWPLARGWLAGLQQGWIDLDIYAKRMGARLLSAYAALAKGTPSHTPELLRDLRYFCSQAIRHAQRQQLQLPAPLQALQPSTAQPPLSSDAASIVPATALAAPVLAPAALADVPEIQPVKPLVQGLAASAQVEPDAQFLQTAESLTQALDDDVCAWTVHPDAAWPSHILSTVDQLARTSWTAGCTEIASLSHLLQRCLQRLQPHSTLSQRQTCRVASDEIQRLLHQFAAGFLRRAHPQVVDALQALLAQLPAEPNPTQDTHTGATGNLTALHSEDNPNAPADTSTGDLFHALPASTPAAEQHAMASFLGHDAAPAPDTLQQAAATENPEATAPTADTSVLPSAPATTPAPPQPQSTASTRNSTPAHTLAAMDVMHFSVFEEEMLTAWPRLHAALKQWMQAPEDAQARQMVMRCLHTLKGSARLAGIMAWASQVHALETMALEVPSKPGPLGPASLQQPLEALRIAFVALQQEMADRYPERHQLRLQHQPLDTVARHSKALWATQDAAQQAVGSNQITLQAMADNLQQLRTQLKECVAWADSLMLHSDMESSYEWHEDLHALIHSLQDCTDDLGMAHQQLLYSTADAHSALQTQAGHLRALQQTLLYARLVPLSSVQDRLNSCVELASRDTFKPVELRWQGADTLMESEVLEAITPALEHLLRNCVAHGIESMVGREAAKKPATGRILIALRNQGRQQILSLYDDGAGLNLPAIRRKAVALGLIDADAEIDNAKAAKLILQPGLSTAPEVTELAGRGIGMDVVDDTIRQLHGRLHITSKPGQGCRFDIVLPAPPKVEQVLALRAGSWHVALPAASVESVRQLPEEVAEHALQQGVLQDDASGPLPVYWAGAVWQQSARSLERSLDGLRRMLVLRSDTARWGLLVDEIIGTQEVTLQAPTDMEFPLPGLLGTAAQPTGQILQVYDPAAVLPSYEARLHQQHDADALDAADQPVPERPLILVADDSLSVRRLAQHLLQSQGYRVETAIDGVQAWNYLENHPAPALLIADIEMPDLDGLELLRRVRADSRFKQLPVVMLTAHSAGPLSQKAIDLGAQAFLTKPYAPNELLAQVRRYGAVSASASHGDATSTSEL